MYRFQLTRIQYSQKLFIVDKSGVLKTAPLYIFPFIDIMEIHYFSKKIPYILLCEF